MGLKIPDGYRLLKEGEKMREGDIYYHPLGVWFDRTKDLGFSYKAAIYFPTARLERVPDDLLWD